VFNQLKQECQFDALLCTGIAPLWYPGSKLLEADEELRQEGDIASNMKPVKLEFQRGEYLKYLLVREIMGILSERQQQLDQQQDMDLVFTWPEWVHYDDKGADDLAKERRLHRGAVEKHSSCAPSFEYITNNSVLMSF
jgi:hypothetical protein